MTQRNKLKSRRKAPRRQSVRANSRRSPFEFGALFRLCQLLVAAFLLYITASLFAVGAGVLGRDVSSCILRVAGGGIILILLHLFYGLFCSLLRRQVSSVLSQWLGTFSLYIALSLFLGLLQKTDLRLDIGLLSPGIIGTVAAAVFPRFIGAVGAMLVGLCFVSLSAFNYGHLSAARVAWLRAQCAKIHLPSLPSFHLKRTAREDSFDEKTDEDRDELESSGGPDDDDADAEDDTSEEDIAPDALSDGPDETPAAEPVKQPRARSAFIASIVSAFSLLMGHAPKEQSAETGTEETQREYADAPEDGQDGGDSEYDPAYEDYGPEPADEPDYGEREQEEYEPQDKFIDEEPAPATEPEQPVRRAPQPAAVRSGVRSSVSEPAPAASRPKVEIDPSGNLRGTEDVEYRGGREIPAGSFPPPLDLLGPHQVVQEVINDQKAKENGEEVIATLANFGVTAELKRTIIGPTVVQYQIQLAPGIKVSKVSSLGNDIAVALGVPSIRVEAPIPGTSYIGIELPNTHRRAVPLRQVIESDVFQNTKLHLPLPLGQTVDGRILISGLEELPHLLIAGTTGSGKSIFVNNCIIAMCYHNTPADLRFIMVDPKRVEMGIYETLPHMLARPIVTAAAAVHALAWAVREMDRRYDVCAQVKARNIASYNEKVLPKDRLPHIVIIVDELADLMMTAQKEVEECIMRLAQMARAVGIHLMLATQRPSVNVLTGTIKANIPARVSFSLPSATDSRTILDTTGAQNLLGKGDMLFVSTRHPHPLRIQSPFMDEQTNIRIVEYLRNTFGDPEYVDLDEQGEDKKSGGGDFLEDSRLEEAIKIVLGTGVASSSGLQRQMRVGFTRAARLLDTMEAMGIVGASNGSKPREILVDEGEALEILEQHREG